jgi:ABC-type lipopolysaccharide export system ATPase subunit
MVEINISIKGEDIEEIIEELLNVGIGLLKSNRKEIREILQILADDSLDVLLEHKTLEKGAMLYRKINSEINWTYKRDKNKV